MTINDIKTACDDIACHPSENHSAELLMKLVEEAKKHKYNLEFHIGQDLTGKAYIQGYILEKQITAD